MHSLYGVEMKKDKIENLTTVFQNQINLLYFLIFT